MSEVRSKNNGGRLRLASGIFAFVTIVIAWFVGDALVNSDIQPFLQEVIPQAERFDPLADGVYQAVALHNGKEELLGYVTTGRKDGYGGPVTVMAGLNLSGDIIGFTVVNHKETPSYFDKIVASEMYNSLKGKNAADGFEPGGDIDAVTGATWSARGLSGAVKQAARQIASVHLAMELPPEAEEAVDFGFKEILLIMLFLSGFLIFNPRIKINNQLRWVSMILGMATLGFIYNFPLTISRINSLLLGYFPDWRYDLFWIILIAGIVISTLIFNKNPYCRGFCPFGAAQECLGAVGGAKTSGSKEQKRAGRWIKRVLAWLVIILALILRNPSVGSYEVFGGLFSLTASTVQFILLISVLLASLFIRRPWCTYLCPIDPVVEFIKGTRKLVSGLWQKKRKTTKTPSA